MAGIKQPILSVMSQTATVSDFNQYVRIWNNQVDDEDKGRLYDFPKPAAFIELINSPVYDEIGVGFKSSDLGFKIHIVAELFDAQDGTFEQNLLIFDLRDKVVAALSLFEPTACGPLVLKTETQDFKHTNIYHYVVDFVCNFTDSIGSPYDPASGKLIDSNPPTGIEINSSKTSAASLEYIPTSNFNIPQ